MPDALRFVHAADPVGWSTRVFLVAVAALLGLRQFLPRSLPRARELCLLAAAGVGYFLVRGAEIGRYDRAIAHARRVVALERWLGIFVEPALQRRVLATPRLGTIANWVYVWGHWPVIAAVLLWLARQHPAAYPRYRTAILLSGAVGLVVFARYPVAPPRLVPDLGVVDTIAAGSHSYRVLQPPALANPYAALPSLHVGWDLLMGVALVRHAAGRLARTVGVLLPVAMTAAVVLTANHYLLDAVAGIACALVGLFAAGGVPAAVRASLVALASPTRALRPRARVS